MAPTGGIQHELRSALTPDGEFLLNHPGGGGQGESSPPARTETEMGTPAGKGKIGEGGQGVKTAFHPFLRPQ